MAAGRWDAGAVSARVRPALAARDIRQVAFVVALVAVSVALRLATWDPVADGDRARFIKVTVLGGGAAIALFSLVRAHVAGGSWAPLLWAVVCLLTGDVVHYARLANPITRGGPILAVSGTLADATAARREWDFETSGDGTIVVADGGLRLASSPGSTAYVSARAGAAPSAERNWLLPVGLLERERAERVAWRASVRRTGAFYVVAELRRLLIQAVGYGVHVTYLDERDALRGHEIEHPVGSDAQIHEWDVTRDPRQVTLRIDGRTVWSAPAREAITQVRFGESKTDPQHGGSMTLLRATYTVAIDRS